MIKALGRAMQSSNLKSRTYECDVDRIAALAFSGPGAAILRAELSLDSQKLREAHTYLTACLVQRTNYPHDAGQIAMIALYESMVTMCRTCHGAGELRDEHNGVLAVCDTCQGVGVRRMTKRERMCIGGLKTWHNRHERLLSIATQIVSGQTMDALGRYWRQLQDESC